MRSNHCADLSAGALLNEQPEAATPDPEFRIFAVEIDYREHYPALAEFERFIHVHRKCTFESR